MPDYWYVAEAAKELNCSFMELDEHPDKHKLMSKAFTLIIGRSNGEYAMQLAPWFIKRQKERQKKIDAAQARHGK